MELKNTLGSILVIYTLIGIKSVCAEEIATPKVEERIVELRITRQQPAAMENRYKRRVEKFASKAVCSGSFVDNNGLIITAGHCAQDAASIEVVTSDNQHYEATIVATSSTHDLALLHIDRHGTPHFNLAEKVKRGQQIFILGSPLGITDTLSTGIIAKLDGDVLLVDCSALPGNSGSAVYNADGEMVGVLTSGFIVMLGTTHLNVVQSNDAIWFFIIRALRGVRQ